MSVFILNLLYFIHPSYTPSYKAPGSAGAAEFLFAASGLTQLNPYSPHEECAS